MASQTRRRSTESGFSAFRIGLMAAGAGLVFIVGAIIMTAIDQAGQRQPLNIDPPAGAELRDAPPSNGTSRTLIYAVPNSSPDEVAEYYNGKLREFYGDDVTRAELCKRNPASGNYEGYKEGDGTVPYEFVCLFDTSSFGSDRFTEVTIQPGIRSDVTGVNNEGFVFVQYEQSWQS